MLKFKIFEIPEGQSQRTVELSSDDLEIEGVPFKGATLDINFYRTLQFIQVKFGLKADIELVCDRSLDEFDHQIETNYQVLFKAEEVEESADETGSIRNIDVHSKQIDLEQDVLDTIMLNLPVKKLHPRFLDENGNPNEFVNEKFGESSDDGEEKIDPRWEALKELKK
jgi:uncharacterized metal-binding protein YceD (DUF177 family)